MSAHRYARVIGLTDPRAANIRIECTCGHVSEAPTFAGAAKLHEEHRVSSVEVTP